MKWKNIFSDKKDDENIEIEYYSKDKKEQDSDSKLTKIKNWFTANDSYSEDDFEFEDELYYDNEDENYQESSNNKKSKKNNYKYHEDDDYLDVVEDDFEEFEIEYTDELKSNNKIEKTTDSKLSKFKNLFTSNDKYEEDLDFDEKYEYDIEDDTHSSKSSKFKNLFTSNDKYSDDDFDDDYVHDKEEDTHSSKSSKFKKLFTTNDPYADDSDFNDEDEGTINNNNKVNKNQNKNSSLLEKIKNFFKTEEFESYEEKESKVYSDYEDDKPEDYKTYLEKQKQKNKEKDIYKENLDVYDESFEELDVEVYDEDYSDFEEKEEKENKLSIFKNLKEKFVNKDVSKVNTNEINGLDLDSSNDDEAQNLEQYDIDREENTIEKELEIIEENSLEGEEKENKNIMETLQSLGIEATEIKDVDVFEERENKRTHPTLASMKVKRILQEQNIDNLSTKLVFEDSKDKFSKEFVEKEDDIVEYEENNYDNRTSKNKEQIEQLDNDFNNIERKPDKISVSENYIQKKDDTELDNAINEIKETKEQAKKDTKNYDIVFNDSYTEIERREKVKYTSIDDVLKDNEEFLEDDIDRIAKKIVVTRDYESVDEASEDIKNFREDTLNNENKKYSSVELDPKKQTTLDKLIIDSNILEKDQDDTTREIEKLEENLSKVIDDKSSEETNKINEVIDFSEKEPIIKRTSLEGYSDYNLELEEIEELTIQNKIESKSEDTDIDSLNKSLGKNITINNDVDKFKEEKTYTPPLKNFKIEVEEEDLVSEKEKIEYTEKLYSNEVNEYFVDDNSPLTFGEYKTQDRGYRPVSRETIESNQKKLDEIFAKYSNTSINKKISTTSVENKITNPTSVKNVGKFKPSVVYSSVYGSNNNNAKSENREDNKMTENKKKASKVKPNSKNLFKEIASQDEAIWNIEINSRVPKSKGKKK